VSFDLSELTRFANGLGATGSTIASALSKSAGQITSVARSGYAAGMSPDGDAWVPTKDGRLAVQGPASKVVFAVRGTELVGTAPDVLTYHEETRPVFPRGAIPDAWDAILTRNVVTALDESVKP